MISDKIATAFKQHKWLYYAVSALCGLLLTVATFSTAPVVQLISIFAIIPVIAIMLSDIEEKINSYLFSLAFFGAWILPTTYWYYSFMNPLLAVAASVGSVFLFANLFRIFAFRKRLSDYLVALLFSAAWALFTYLRLRLPVTKDCWIPHLGYAVWRNPAILQLSVLGGEAGIDFFVLLFSSACAVLLIRKKQLVTLFGCGSALAFILIFNRLISHMPVVDLPIIIAAQSSTPQKNLDATPEVIQKIEKQTKSALNSLGDTNGREVYVVWPENRIPPANQQELSLFARDNDINLIYHSYEPIEGKDAPYKIIVWLDSSGEIVLTNSKEHIAPGEQGTPRKSANVKDGITAYICYDVHYTDIVPRMRDANLVFVALNDEEFGDLQKTFHLADMALRSVQARVWIATASKDGPSAIISLNGYVVQVIPYHLDGVIIFQ